MACTTLSAQRQHCGYKTDCNCNSAEETIRYAYEHSQVVLEGIVVNTDTVALSEIIVPNAVMEIRNDTTTQSVCAKNILKKGMALRIELDLNKVYKGKTLTRYPYILTPFKYTNCGFSEFTIGENYMIYGTFNETADRYYLWTFDRDYFKLKKGYRAWTNLCKRTKKSGAKERRRLAEIIQSSKN